MCADCVLTFQAENTCEDFMRAMMSSSDQPSDWVDSSCMDCIESIYAVCMGFSNGPDCKFLLYNIILDSTTVRFNKMKNY